jgi:hypothetical protein
MIALQDITFKHFSESDASAQDKEIDCLNADYLVVQFFTSGGSDGAMAELQLLESDTSGSGQVAICSSWTFEAASVSSPLALMGLLRLPTTLQRSHLTISDRSPTPLPTGKSV